jgi:hypothetical protein
MIGSMMEFVCDMLEDVSVLGRCVDIEGSMMMMMTMVVASVLCGWLLWLGAGFEADFAFGSSFSCTQEILENL